MTGESPIPPGPAVQRPQLSVVIPTLRNPELMRRVLDAYEQQDAAPGSYELIVVVDPADPDPGALDRVIGQRRFPVRRITGASPGAAGGRNAGWRLARGPIVLFTDDDILPGPRLVSEHLRIHRDLPDEAVAVLGRVRWARGLNVTPFMRWLEQGVAFEFGSIRGTEASWAHLYSCNSSLKRSFLERLDGFDAERFPFGYEDLDLGLRGHQLGLRVVYNPEAVVEHWRHVTLAMWQQKAFRIGAAERRFCAVHPEAPPTLWQRFSDAAARPPQRGRAAVAARLVPRRAPWFGPMVWNLADLYWRQQIAPQFLAGWATEGDPSRPPSPGPAPGEAALAERGRVNE